MLGHRVKTVECETPEALRNIQSGCRLFAVLWAHICNVFDLNTPMTMKTNYFSPSLVLSHFFVSFVFFRLLPVFLYSALSSFLAVFIAFNVFVLFPSCSHVMIDRQRRYYVLIIGRRDFVMWTYKSSF